ncbi:BatA domain-containing protein [Kordiimonas gwangyangensis]|uniref:BatA domain-containing protein n=1 Tax=Kordiimonas gwangyangensis TaxID=288022 RepID=UPI0004712706|nr:BatA domain-containing protein [Kordiimonas gwangyangensis]
MSSLFGMFHFANPLGLLALLAVAVPILIHLLNKSKGNLVVVGTLDFIRGAKSKRVTEVKLTNLILLLLRIAILALAALCVAELMSTKGKGTSESSVFVTPAWAQKASREDWLSASAQPVAEQQAFYQEM